MNIIILEDSLQQQQRLSNIINTITNIKINDIFISSRVSDVIDKVSNGSQANVYLLDLEINDNEYAGFNCARRIRELDTFGIIIFVTTHSNMAPITFEYQVSALDFISKDLEDSEFENRVLSCIDKANEQLNKLIMDVDYYLFENKYSKFKIPFNDILYFETSQTPHKIRMIAKNKVVEFYGDLKELENTDDRLFRVHRAFIVNLENIIEVDKSNKEVIFDAENTCLVSRRLMKEVINKLNEYL